MITPQTKALLEAFSHIDLFANHQTSSVPKKRILLILRGLKMQR
jgi:hypothetical protein